MVAKVEGESGTILRRALSHECIYNTVKLQIYDVYQVFFLFFLCDRDDCWLLHHSGWDLPFHEAQLPLSKVPSTLLSFSNACDKPMKGSAFTVTSAGGNCVWYPSFSLQLFFTMWDEQFITLLNRRWSDPYLWLQIYIQFVSQDLLSIQLQDSAFLLVACNWKQYLHRCKINTVLDLHVLPWSWIMH